MRIREQRLRLPALRFLTGVVLCLVTPPVAISAADDKDKPTGEELVGQLVDVELSSGKRLTKHKVVAVRVGKVGGTVAAITLAEPETQKRTSLGAAGVKSVSQDCKSLLIFDDEAKTLVLADLENLDEVRAALRAGTASPVTPRRKPEKSGKAGEKPVDEAERRRQRQQEREEVFRRTGVRLWPDLDDEQQAAALAKQKEFLDKVKLAFKPLNMQLSETKHFLFLSDIPPQQTAIYVLNLDKMYEELLKAFALPKGTNVWAGKGVVIAFLNKENFMMFERTFYRADVTGAAGLAHLSGDGNAVISLFRGDNPAFFAGVLVHETSHGFMHRYKSPKSLPAWLNEGAADWIAGAVVTMDQTVAKRQQQSISFLRQTGTFGGEFFVSGDMLPAHFYGAASSITGFLLRTDAKRYRKLIDEIKLGTPWEQALKDAYGWTPADLAARWGLSVGIPNLRP